MSQDALTVVNGSGLNVRNAFNLAIKAINSDFAGATDPATMVPSNAFAYMMWADTQNELIKQRNADNSAWVTLGALGADGTIKWDVSKLNMAGTLGGALHQPTPIIIASVDGVLTLTEGGNSFTVSGTEDIISVTGWSAGRVVIKWGGARTIKNNSNIAISISTDRSVLAGDISEFEFTGAGQVREINYLSSYAGATNIPQVGVPDNIVNGMTISAGTGLQAVVGTGRAIISEIAVTYDVFTNTITLSPRMASLIYAKLDKTVGKIEAVLPAVDANTIVRYDFSNWDGVSAIPNSAVGVNGNTVAVANPLTKSGTVNRVDGHCGYVGQGDGSTGYFTSANSTGFPIGAERREIVALFTLNSIRNNWQVVFNYGTSVSNTMFALLIYPNTNRLYVDFYNTRYDTGLDIDVGKPYFSIVNYDGSILRVYVNGCLIFQIPIALTTAAGILTLLKAQWVAEYINGTIHYLELRNKMRTPAQIAQISNALLLPCSYQTPQSPVPLMTANSSQGCTVTASSEQSGYNAYMAFRKGSVLGDGSWNLASGYAGWIQIQYPNLFCPKWIDLTAISSGPVRMPKDFTVSGSTNGTDYTTILTVTGATGWTANQRRRFNILTTSSFTILKLTVTANNNGGLLSICDIDFGTDIVSTTDIRSILPANSISIGYTKTNSASVVEIDSSSYKYGIRQGATGGSRVLISEWKYSTGTTYFNNPFVSTSVRVDVYIKTAADSTTWIKVPSAGVSVTPWKINLTSTGTGYVSIIAEVIE